MRILMLTPRFPYPPQRGDTLRSWTLLNGLARRHEVWLASVDCVAPRATHLAHVRGCCREVAVFVRPAWARMLRGAGSLLGGASLTEGYFRDARLAETVQRWSAGTPFDAVLTYSSSIAPAAAAVRARRRVLDLGDVDSRKWDRYARWSAWPRSALFRLEAQRVAALEARGVRGHDVCLLVNERERRKFAESFAGVRADVVPTTVEWDAVAASAPTGDVKPPAAPVLGMVGSMGYPPNVRAVEWFGRSVWPLVRHLLPGAQWLIVGREPSRAVRRWGRCSGVSVTGYVPDVRPYLASMRVFVDPVEGDIGVQSKLVQALAAGRPAVVSSDVAAGMAHAGAAPFLVADSPEHFAAAVVRLATEDELWMQFSRRAREVVAESYAPQPQIERVERWLGVEA